MRVHSAQPNTSRTAGPPNLAANSQPKSQRWGGEPSPNPGHQLSGRWPADKPERVLLPLSQHTFHPTPTRQLWGEPKRLSLVYLCETQG